MTKRIITINRMYGSNGRKIGKALADKLGIQYYDKELIRIASEKEGIPYEELQKVDEAQPVALSAGRAHADGAPVPLLSHERRTIPDGKRDHPLPFQAGRLRHHRALRRTYPGKACPARIYPCPL